MNKAKSNPFERLRQVQEALKSPDFWMNELHNLENFDDLPAASKGKFRTRGRGML